MNSKRYVFLTLVMQMVVVPIILTLGLILVSAIFAGLQIQDSGDTAKLIAVLTAFLGSLIVGAFVGYIFSRAVKSKPESANIRYLTPLLPIVYAFVFALLAVMASKGNYNSSWWGLYLTKNPVFFIFGISVYFSGLHIVLPVAELMGYSGFFLGIYIYEVFAGSVKDLTARRFKSAFAAIFIAVITFSGVSTKDAINNGMIEILYGKSTVGAELTEFNLIEIAPFKDKNGLAKLDKPASLQFNEFESMPRLDGATAAYPVYGAFVEAVYTGLGQRYKTEKDNPEKDLYDAFVSSETYPYNIVKCSKTSTAYERLINGETDVIFVAEPSKAHLEAVKARGEEFLLTPIGSEAFVFFTNVKNSVENLTVKQLQDIYSGKITNWKEVGGSNKEILPYQRPENSGSQTVMQNRVMKDVKMMEPTKDTFAGGMGEIISEVSKYKNAKNAIGYSFMYYSSEMIKNNQIKYIAIEGIKPTPGTVIDKSYPFSVPVYAVTLKSNNKESVAQLLEWVTSEEGQSLIEKTGYIGLRK